MENSILEKPEELIQLFESENRGEYREFNILTDRDIGFSVKRDYPENIKYYPPRTRDGKNDTVCLIYIVYEPSKRKGDGSRTPLIIKATKFSQYLSKHIDYDFTDKNCPTEESVENSKKTPEPLSLDFLDEYFFDYSSSKFFNKKNQEIKSSQILNEVFEVHCNTTGFLKRIPFYFKIRLRSVISSLLTLLINLNVWCLKTLFGRTLEEKDSISQYFHGYQRSSLKKLSTDSINIFGYKASKGVIISFCILVSLGSFIYDHFNFEIMYLGKVMSNSLLVITHSIICIWILDSVIPEIQFLLVNFLTFIRKKLLFLGI